jgi:hypothetical protein
MPSRFYYDSSLSNVLINGSKYLKINFLNSKTRPIKILLGKVNQFLFAFSTVCGKEKIEKSMGKGRKIKCRIYL